MQPSEGDRLRLAAHHRQRRILLAATTGLLAAIVLVTAYLLLRPVATPASNSQQLSLRDYSLTTLLQRHADASGGLSAQRDLVGLRLHGTIEMEGRSFPAVLTKKSPDRVRIAINLLQGDYRMAFDGEAVWEQPPGQPPHWLDTPMATDFMAEAPLISALIDPAKHNATLSQEPPIAEDGRTFYRILAKTPYGRQQRFWLDASTFLDTRIDSWKVSAPSEVTTQIQSDHRPVEGLLIPHRIVSLKNGQRQYLFTIESVELNPGVLSSHFAFPAEAPSNMTQHESP